MIDEAEVRRKAKRRKYMDAPCDMSIGVDYRNDHPVVIMCPDHRVRFFPELGHFGVYLCDEHLETRLLAFRPTQ
jgi:hypothetical protein